jgi:hypothetical protein
METCCQNPLCENEAVIEVTVSVNTASDQMRSLCATCCEAYDLGVKHGLHMRSPGLQILPPPKEEGPQSLYRIVYVIDVGGRDSHEAAKQAYKMMSAPDSMRPVLHVLDADGRDTILDLAADPQMAETTLPRSDQDARAFVAAAATRCPKCNSETLDFAGMNIVGQSAYQEASCQDCDVRFYVVYRLVGFALEVGDSMEIHTIAEDFGQITVPN